MSLNSSRQQDPLRRDLTWALADLGVDEEDVDVLDSLITTPIAGGGYYIHRCSRWKNRPLVA